MATAVVLGFAVVITALANATGRTGDATAVVATLPPPTASPAASTAEDAAVVATAPAAAAAPTVTASGPSPAPTPSGPPPRLTCHALAAARCGAIARAALAAAADPTLPHPSAIDVWASLLCGSAFDCPPERMAGHRPAGSAVIVAGAIGLWVNVSEAAGAAGTGSFDAWVVRSAPAG